MPNSIYIDILKFMTVSGPAFGSCQVGIYAVPFRKLGTYSGGPNRRAPPLINFKIFFHPPRAYSNPPVYLI